MNERLISPLWDQNAPGSQSQARPNVHEQRRAERKTGHDNKPPPGGRGATVRLCRPPAQTVENRAGDQHSHRQRQH